MLASIIAVVGTLAGAFAGGWLQVRAARAAQDGTDRAERRRERLAAVTSLTAAVADHRRAMYVREEARDGGVSADRAAELRDVSHATRSAITAPLTALRVLIQDRDVQAAATQAVEATYRLREARGMEDLAALRQESVEAERAFVETAGAYLAA